MKMIHKSFIGVCLVLAVSLSIFSCNNSKNQEDQKKTDQVMTDSVNTPKTVVAKYQCPMKCEGDKTYAEAGKCPECEMDLAKIE